VHLTRQADAGDILRAHAFGVKYLPDGPLARAPPVARVLLGPARGRRSEGRVLYGLGRNDAPALVNQYRARSARPNVYAEETHP